MLKRLDLAYHISSIGIFEIIRELQEDLLQKAKKENQEEPS